MTPTGIYIGQSETWLTGYRDELLTAVRAQAAGRVSSISGATKSLSRQHLSPDDLRQELAEVNWALYKLDPETYPNPMPKRRMRADFSDC